MEDCLCWLTSHNYFFPFLYVCFSVSGIAFPYSVTDYNNL